MNKKALLGFVIVLVVTLALAGLTFYKIAEIFGLHQTNKALRSFYEFADNVNEVSQEPVGTRKVMPLYVDEKSAIIGFSRNSNEVAVKTGINHYSPRSSECKTGACLCLCRDYDWRIDVSSWHYYPTAEFQPIRCREKFICRNFEEFDFPNRVSKEDFGLDFDTEGGFMIARNYFLGGQEIEARLTGIYITKESPGLVSVSYNTKGISKETIKQYEQGKEAGKLYNEGITAYQQKKWGLAISSFEKVLDNKIEEGLPTGQRDQLYFLRGMAYYKKGDKQKAIEKLDEGITFVSDAELRNVMREKIEEIKRS